MELGHLEIWIMDMVGKLCLYTFPTFLKKGRRACFFGLHTTNTLSRPQETPTMGPHPSARGWQSSFLLNNNLDTYVFQILRN